MSGYSGRSLEDICYSPERVFSQSVAHKDEKANSEENGTHPTVDTDGIADTNDLPKKPPVYIAAGEIRNRLKEQSEHEPHKVFKVSLKLFPRYSSTLGVRRQPSEIGCLKTAN